MFFDRPLCRLIRPLLGSSATLLLAVGLSGCGSLKRFPGPMAASRNPLPEGSAALYPEGPEEVLIIRHADTVQVQPPGVTGAFPLTFYDKQERVRSGSWVFSGSGGLAEILWPSNASVQLFGVGVGTVASPSRGEPSFVFWEMERAKLQLREGDQVALLGGALLSVNGGPVVIERLGPEIQRLHNRSKAVAQVAFREEIFRLDPGDAIDLPILEIGSHPIEQAPPTRTIGGVDIWGELEVLSDRGALQLRAQGEHEIRGRGVRLRMDPGQEAVFTGLDPRGAVLRDSEPVETDGETQGGAEGSPLVQRDSAIETGTPIAAAAPLGSPK